MAGEAAQPSPRHWILLGALLLLILAVVLPPLVNIGRYQRIIAASISRSIGRPVSMSSVTLSLLPLPSFELSDFLVEEEPQFGAEPILRASSVVAYPRLSSLWRGKLEISRIHFDEASLNLVRRPDGSWNFSSILVQAARSPEAPTGQRRPGSAPRFPYIEATNSRINFKQGDEKKPLSFLDADLSVSLDNPDEWGLHFRAQPVRTDLALDLADSGVLRIDGTLHRAEFLNEMPLKLNVEWSSEPLGQLSRLLLGEDAGWRGNLDAESQITGSASLARIKTTLKVNGLHRSEFAPAQPLDIFAVCNAFYDKPTESLESIDCASPAGGGNLQLTGSIRNIQAQRQSELALNIRRVSASAVLGGLQELRDGLGSGLRAVGAVDGQVRYAASGDDMPQISGKLGMSSLTLISAESEKSLLLSPVHLRFENRSTPAPIVSAVTKKAAAQRKNSPLPSPPALLLEPIRLSLGAASPLTVDGRFTPAGFDLHLNGSGAVARLRGLSKVISWAGGSAGGLGGASTVALGTSGAATLDLNVRGPWLLPVPDPEHPVAPFTIVGSVALKNAELTTSFLAQPVKILSAQGLLGASAVTWTDVSIGLGSLQGEGTLEYPILCTVVRPCSGRFQLGASALDLGELQSALLASPKGELLQEILNRIDGHPVAWPQLSGVLQVGTLSAGKLVLHDAAGDLAISGNSLEIHSIDGRLLNGTMHLTGNMAMLKGVPRYALEVEVTGASPAALAGLFAEHWGSGQADFSAQLAVSGLTAQDLARSASGTLHWNWSKGSLAAQTALPVSIQSLLHFDSWSGDAAIGDATLSIDHSLLEHGREAIPLSGTISFSRDMDLKSESEANPFSVTGTLEHPRVKSLATVAHVDGFR
ncbi:MAG TPA: AsmA family protein [Acidobacteriaceae bacterium]|nr:AsmA family protein [Acidobacteriaceae bacterium]